MTLLIDNSDVDRVVREICSKKIVSVDEEISISLLVNYLYEKKNISKYKKRTDKPLKIEDYQKYYMNKWETIIKKYKGKCLNYECNNPPIKAHSLQKKGILKKISEGSKVLQYKKTNNKDNNVTEIGIGQASTFKGFCEHHDKQFSCFEDCEYKASHEQNFKIYKRTVAHECHKNRANNISINHYDDMMQKIPTINDYPIMISRFKTFPLYAGIADVLISKEMEEINKNDKEKRFSHIESISLHVENANFIASSGILNLRESKLNTPKSEKTKKHIIKSSPLCTINTIEYLDNIAIIISYRAKYKIRRKINKIIKHYKDDAARFFILLMIVNIKNTYYSSQWYDSLSPEGKKRMAELSEIVLLEGQNDMSKLIDETIYKSKKNLSERNKDLNIMNKIQEEMRENKLNIKPKIISILNPSNILDKD